MKITKMITAGSRGEIPSIAYSLSAPRIDIYFCSTGGRHCNRQVCTGAAWRCLTCTVSVLCGAVLCLMYRACVVWSGVVLDIPCLCCVERCCAWCKKTVKNEVQNIIWKSSNIFIHFQYIRLSNLQAAKTLNYWVRYTRYSDLFVSGVSTALGSDYVTRIFGYNFKPFSSICTD